MFTNDLFTNSAEVSWIRFAFKELLRTVTPWVLCTWFLIDANIFSYLYLVIGLVLMSQSNKVGTVNYEEHRNTVRIYVRGIVTSVFAFLVVLVNIGCAIYVRIFVKINAKKGQGFKFSYIHNLLGIKMFKLLSMQKLVGLYTLLFCLVFFSMFLRFKHTYELTLAKMMVLKRGLRTFIVPLRAIIYLYLIVMSMRIGISILSTVYRSALVVILIRGMLDIHNSGKLRVKNLKIKMSWYIKILLLTTQLFLMIFAMATLLFECFETSNDASISDNRFKNLILLLKNIYAKRISTILMSSNLTASLIFYWLMSFYLFIRSLLSLRKYEKDMLREILDHKFCQLRYHLKRSPNSKPNKDSYYNTYFTKNVFSIFQLNFMCVSSNQTRRLKKVVLAKLIKSKKKATSHIKEMKSKRRYRPGVIGKVKKLSINFSKVVIAWLAMRIYDNMVSFFSVVLNFMVFRSIYSNAKPNPFQAAVMSWLLMSYVVSSRRFLVNYSLYFVLPVYLFSGIASDLTFFMLYLFARNQPQMAYDLDNVILFSGLLILTFCLIIAEGKEHLDKEANVQQILTSKLKIKEQVGKGFISSLGIVIKYIIYQLQINFRFVALFFGLMASLVTINLFNSFLLVVTLTLVWTQKYDMDHWIHYCYYTIFFIPLIYVSNIVSSNNWSYNLEITSIVGVYGGIFPYFNERMILHFLNAWTASIYCSFLRKKEVKSKVVEEISAFNWKILRLVRKIYMGRYWFYENYMIWLFHGFLYLILFAYKYDFVNFIVLIAEAIILPWHIIIWVNKPKTAFQRMYKSWKILYWLIIMLAVWRYVLFFARYSIVKRFFTMVFSLIGNKISLLILRNEDDKRLDNLYAIYIQELLLLLLNSLTLSAFKRKLKLDQKVEKDSQELVALNKKQRAAGNRKSLLGDEKENQSSENENGSKTDEEEQKSTEEEEENISQTPHMPGDRRNWLIVIFILISTTLINLYMTYFIYVNINSLKVIIGIFPIIYVNFLFLRTIVIMTKFNFREIMVDSLTYFDHKFVKSIIPSDFKSEYDEDNNFGGYRDQLDNYLFIDQLAMKLDRKLSKHTMRLWGLIFGSMMFYIIVMMAFNIVKFVNSDNHEGKGGVEKKAFLESLLQLLITGLNSRLHVDMALLNSEMMRVDLTMAQKVICLMLIQMLVLNYFDQVKNHAVMMDDHERKIMVDCMKARCRFYATREDRELDLSERDEIEETFVKALKLRNQAFGKEIEDFEKYISHDLNHIKYMRDHIEGTNRMPDKEEYKKQPHRVIHMTESTSKIVRLLYYNRNVQKLSVAQALNSSGYFLRRLCIIPLLIPLDYSQNFMNLLYLLATYLFSMRNRQHIEESVKRYFPIFAILGFSQLIVGFVIEIIKFIFQGENNLTLTISNLITESSTASTTLRNLAFILVACGLCSALGTGAYVFRDLFTIKEDTRNKRFYRMCEDGNEVSIDFKSWKMQLSDSFPKLIKIVIMSVEPIYGTGLVIFAIYNPKASFVVFMMFITFLFNVIQKFTKYSDKKHINRIRLIVSFMSLFLFLRAFVLQIMSLNIVIDYFKDLLGIILIFGQDSAQRSEMVLFLSLCVGDIISMKNFVEMNKKLREESDLKDKLATICYKYDINSQKAFDRVLVMMSNKNLSDQVQQFFDEDTNLKDIKVDTGYFKTDIRKKIRQIKYDLMEKYYGKARVSKMKFIESIYCFLNQNSNVYRGQDALYLIGVIMKKNRSLISNLDFDLQNYMCKDFREAHRTIQIVLAFYEGLRQHKSKNVRYYNQKLKEFKKTCGDMGLNTPRAPPSVCSFDLGEDEAVWSNKPKGELRKAARLLFDKICDNRFCRLYKVSDSSIRFKLGEQYAVVFNNLVSGYAAETEGFTSFKPMIMLRMLLSLIETNAEVIVCVMIMLDQLDNGGVINFVITGIVLFRVLIDSSNSTLPWWDLLNVIFFCQMCCKYLIGLDSLNTINLYKDSFHGLFDNFSLLASFLFGNTSYFGDAICQVLIVWLIVMLKRQGYGLKNSYMLDNPSTSSVRFIVNKTLDRPFVNQVKHEMRKYNGILSKLYRKGKMPRSKILYYHILYSVKAHRAVDNITESFLRNMKKLVLLTRDDIFRLKDDQIQSFFWKNFSSKQRKRGVNMKIWILVAVFLSVIALFFGYSRISPNPVWFFNSFIEDDLKGDLWLHVLIFLTISSLQLFFVSDKPIDKAGLRSKPLIHKYIKSIDLEERVSKKSMIFQSPSYRFKRKARILLNLIKVFRPKGPKTIFGEVYSNPLYRLYICQIFFWVYLNILIYFRLIIKGHTDKRITGFLEKYKCFFQLSMNCHPREQYYWTKLIYFTSTLWLLILTIQIKIGLPKWTTTITKFDMVDKLKFYAILYTPFLREIIIVCRFAASKTSLNVFNWLTIDDITAMMVKAKFMQKARDQHTFDQKPSFVFKSIVSFVITLFLILVFIGPMLLFSNMFSASQVHDVYGAEVRVGVYSYQGIALGDLFSSKLMLESKTLESNNTDWNFLNSSMYYKSSTPQMFKLVKMSQYSQTYNNFMLDKTTNNTLVDKFLSGGSIRIYISFTTSEGTFPKLITVPIIDSSLNEIKQFIQTKCASARMIKEIFLTNVPSVYTLKTLPDIEPLEDISIQRKVSKKWSLGLKCSYFQQTYFYISSGKTNDLEFVVKTKPKMHVTDFIANTFGIKLNILILYVFFFRYIGITLIRKFTFGKTTLIWYTDIPSPEVMFVLIDAIEVARMEMDLLREDILYFYMIELLRNPEDVKSLTGKMLHHQLRNFHQHNKNQEKMKHLRRLNSTQTTKY